MPGGVGRVVVAERVPEASRALAHQAGMSPGGEVRCVQ